MGNFNPKNPTKFRGTDKNITFFVTRKRRPTGADYRQPETGNLYSVGTVWQIGKDPTTGLEGDLWMLSKIVANVAYWIEVSGGGGAGLVNEFTTDDALTVLPDALGNVNVFGLGETSTQGDVANTIGILSPRTAKFVVDPTLNNGTHQTITAAMAAASSGSVIFIRPGTYTENLTLKAGVDLVAYSSDYVNGQVEIVGKLTYTAAGTVNLYNLKLTTNSDYFLEVTGANDSVMNIRNCYLNVTNNNGINITCTGASREIVFDGCYGDITTTLISYFTLGGSGGGYLGQGIFFKDCHFRNTGNSTTASTVTSTIRVEKCFFMFPLSFTAGGLFARFSEFNCNNINTTALTIATSNSLDISTCYILGGTASAISIGAGATTTISNSTISSSNINVITGAGSLTYGGLTFPSTSSNTNVTTETISKMGRSMIVGGTHVGEVNYLSVENRDNTNSLSGAYIEVRNGGLSGGDAYMHYIIGGFNQEYAHGIDVSDSENWKLSAGGNVSTGTTLMKITPSGEITMPLQPAFLGVLGTADLNVTGNGATYVLGSGNALTEVFDQGGDFVTTGTFTAPVTGKYPLASNFVMGNITAAMTFQGMNITTSNRTYQFGFQNDGAVQTVAVVPGIISSHGSVLADMDAGDTFTTSLAISGGAGDTADSSPSGARIFMSGYLAC